MPFSRSKIYDCFIFFNELDLLLIRLEELYDSVDYFVLVEAEDTFRGKDKPLHFHENRALFARYSDKIIYVKLEKTDFADPWDRERWQRNQIMRGLKGCSQKDIIIISDLDEFIDARKIPLFVSTLARWKTGIVSSDCYFYRWFLNRESALPWIGSAVCHYSLFLEKTPEQVRAARTKRGKWYRKRGKAKILPKSGWHFSNVGGLKTYVEKLEAFSHSEADLPINKDPKHVDACVRKEMALIPKNDTFPKYMRENWDVLVQKGLIDHEARELGKL